MPVFLLNAVSQGAMCMFFIHCSTKKAMTYHHLYHTRSRRPSVPRQGHIGPPSQPHSCRARGSGSCPPLRLDVERPLLLTRPPGLGPQPLRALVGGLVRAWRVSTDARGAALAGAKGPRAPGKARSAQAVRSMRSTCQRRWLSVE